MHRLKEIMEKLEESAKCEFDKGVHNVNTKEMGEVIDMIKDICEAMYYYECYEQMSNEMMNYDDYENRYYRGQPRSGRGQYTRGRRMYEPDYRMTPEMYRNMDVDKEMTEREKRDIDKRMGRMYYTEPNSDYNHDAMRDEKEGRSGMSRRSYMETKEMHKANTPEDKQKKMQSLDSYMSELASDITELIEGATPEERTLLKQKLTNMSNKV